ncbi:MAG: hypothetical protein AB7F64_00875, partial [Gammaproteobacteria bacterium]
MLGLGRLVRDTTRIFQQIRDGEASSKPMSPEELEAKADFLHAQADFESAMNILRSSSEQL